MMVVHENHEGVSMFHLLRKKTNGSLLRNEIKPLREPLKREIEPNITDPEVYPQKSPEIPRRMDPEIVPSSPEDPEITPDSSPYVEPGQPPNEIPPTRESSGLTIIK
jgi:hypothetical protein